MKAFYLERGGSYLSASGWGRTMTGAMKFDTDAAARAGMLDLTKAYPTLMSGDVRIVSREVEPPLDFGAQVHVEYDPFGVRP